MNLKNKYILCFKKDHFLIFTSYKVAFSSLNHLVWDKKLVFFDKKDLEKIDFNDFKSLALIRNPIRRIESIYKDKIVINANPDHIQECQKEIINIFSRDVFFNKQITFEDFICNLHKFINSDAHFYPQNYFIPDSIDKYLSIENIGDTSSLENIIGCKLPVKNKTPKIKLKWTKEMKNIIYSLYDIDFKRFYKKFI